MAAGPSFAAILLLLPLLAMLVIGIVLIFTARRKGKGHPACGACGYDLTASVGTVARCPECGAEFKAVGITPPTTNTRRGTLIAGIVLVVLPLTCVGGILVFSLVMAAGWRQSATIPAPAPVLVPIQPSGQPQGTPPRLPGFETIPTPSPDQPTVRLLPNADGGEAPAAPH